jgi:hypothetical protein
MLSPRPTGGRDPCIDGALDLGLWALCRPRLLVHAGSVHAGVPVLETGSSLPVPIFLTSGETTYEGTWCPGVLKIMPPPPVLNTRPRLTLRSISETAKAIGLDVPTSRVVARKRQNATSHRSVGVTLCGSISTRGRFAAYFAIS